MYLNPKSKHLFKELKTSFSNGLNTQSCNISTQSNRNQLNQVNPISQKTHLQQLKSFLSTLWKIIKNDNPIMAILILLAGLSIVFNHGSEAQNYSEMYEEIAIVMGVVTIWIITSFSQLYSQKVCQQIKSIENDRKKVQVTRNQGSKVKIPPSELLVGDIVHLSEGSIIPANGFLIETDPSKFTTNQSSISGSSQPVLKTTLDLWHDFNTLAKKNGNTSFSSKNNSSLKTIHSLRAIAQNTLPLLAKGTWVMSGSGKMVVTLIEQEQADNQEVKDSPMQQNLKKIIQSKSSYGQYGAIAITLAVLLRFGLSDMFDLPCSFQNSFSDILSISILLACILLISTPLHLLFVSKQFLSSAHKSMLSDNILPKSSNSCQNLNKITDLIIQDTGILNLNKKMIIYLWNKTFKPIDSFLPQIELSDYFQSQDYQRLFSIACSVNNNASLTDKTIGSATDLAILQMIEKSEYDIEYLRQTNPIELKFPYTSQRKRMSCLVNCQTFFAGQSYGLIQSLQDIQMYDNDNDIQNQNNENSNQQGGKHLILQKGNAKDIILSCDDWMCGQTGKIQPINEQMRQQLRNAIVQMGQRSLNFIALAYRVKKQAQNINVDRTDKNGIYDFERKGFVLLGLIGAKDQINIESKQILKTLKENKERSNIKLWFLSQDDYIPTKTFAQSIGFLDRNYYQEGLIMDSQQFRKRTGGIVCKKCRTERCPCPKTQIQAQTKVSSLRVDTIKHLSQFDLISQNLCILTGVKPKDKEALIIGLKQRNQTLIGLVCGQTTDKEIMDMVDVSIARGTTNTTECIQNQADIILLKDGLKQIFNAIGWSHHMNKQLQTYTEYFLPINSVTIFVIITGYLLTGQIVLKPFQIVWVNTFLVLVGFYMIFNSRITQDKLLIGYNEVQQQGFNIKQKDVVSTEIHTSTTLQTLFQSLAISFFFLSAVPCFNQLLYSSDQTLNAKALPSNSTISFQTLTTFIFMQFVHLIYLLPLKNNSGQNHDSLLSKKLPKAIIILFKLFLVSLSFMFITFLIRKGIILQFNLSSFIGLTAEQLFICVTFYYYWKIISSTVVLIPKVISSVFFKTSSRISSKQKQEGRTTTIRLTSPTVIYQQNVDQIDEFEPFQSLIVKNQRKVQ